MTRETLRRRRARAGFTLVELMVALTIAALVIATIYTLVGASARNFHEQQRVGQTQLATRLALDRLRRDVERAGLHGTPDSALERLWGAGPASRLVALQLTNNETTSRATLGTIQAAADNVQSQADQLVMVGNFTTSDAFLVRQLDGAGSSATLQVSWQGFIRTFGDPTTGAIDSTLFQEVFPSGRLLHITTVSGYHYFVTVSSASVTGAGPTAVATVRFSPALPVGTQGVGGLGEGATVAPLTRVVYGLGQPTGTWLSDLAARDAAVTGPNTLLVRTETDAFTPSVILSQRAVLEWAIHFDVDAILDTAPVGNPPALTFYDDAQAQTQVANNPARVRALLLEIGARTPDQDPGMPWVAPASATAPFASFHVFNNRPGSARVRLGQLEVSLPNLVYRGL